MAGEWLPPSPPQRPDWSPPSAGEEPSRPTFVHGPARGPVETGPRNGMAIAAIACGIAGLVVLLLSIGLWFVVAVPLSTVAVTCARAARRRIASGQAASGAGQAKAGFVLGVIGIVLGIVAGVVWIILLANGLSLEELQRDLERELDRQREGVAALVSLWDA